MISPKEDVVSFKLLDGQSRLLAPEARRTYDVIVATNVGVPSADGLTGKTSIGASVLKLVLAANFLADGQVKSILSKSQLDENVIERIWSLTEQIDASARDDGNWSQLEVYVALNFVQAEMKISLDAMLSRFGGPLRSSSKKITRRSSYAAAPSIPLGTPRSIPAVELPAAVSRSQSVFVATSNRESSLADGPPFLQSCKAEQWSGAGPQPLQHQLCHTSKSESRRHFALLETVEDLEGEMDQRPTTSQMAYEIPNTRSPMKDVSNTSVSLVPAETDATENLPTTIVAPMNHKGLEPMEQSKAKHRVFRSSTQAGSSRRLMSPVYGPDRDHRMSPPPLRPVSDSVSGTFLGHSSAVAEASENEHLLPRSMTVMSSSSRGSTAAEKRQRLADLTAAQSHKAILGPTIKAPGPVPRFGSFVDQCEARNLLAARREEDPNYTEPATGLGGVFKSRTEKEKAKDRSNWKYSKKEYNQALKQVIEQGMGVGIVEALLDFGADVNILKAATDSTVKRARGKDITATPGNYIQTAAAKNQIDTVRLLAHRGAWPRSISEALAGAVQHRHLDVVRILLEHNADPNIGAGTTFKEAVSSHDASTVRLLLQARVPINQDLLDSSLLRAVESGNTDVVSLLVANKANVNHMRASALCKAIELGRSDLLIAIVRGKPTAESVSLAFENVLAPSYISANPDIYLVMDLLLCAGASGPHVDEALVRVVNSGQQKLALLLVDAGASVNDQEAKALRIAAKSGNLKLLRIILNGDIEPLYASRAFDCLPQPVDEKPFDEKLMCQLMSALLRHGASGEPLARALLVGVKRRLMSIITLLMDTDVSIYYKNAKALQIAVAAGDVKIVKSLLRKRTQEPLPLHTLFPLVPRHPRQAYYELVTCFISLGVAAPVLRAAFLRAVDLSSSTVDLPVVKALLAAGVDVNGIGEKCFQDATSTANVELLETLLQYNPKNHLVCASIPAAMSTTPNDVRLKLIDLLMSHQANGGHVTQALIKALEEEPVQAEVVRILLQDKSSVNLLEGQVLTKAALAGSKEMLEIALAIGKPKNESCVNALYVTLQPSTSERRRKHRLLLDHGLPSEAIHQALIREVENEVDCDLEIVKLLIKSGASCDHQNGRALERAIQACQIKLLQQIICVGMPSKHTLACQIPAAMEQENREHKYAMMKLLLEGCEKGLHMDVALLHEVSLGNQTDARLVDLLVRRGAQVDYLDGAAIQSVVSCPARPGLLNTMLNGRYTPSQLSSKIPYAMGNNADMRLDVLKTLLSHGASGPQVDQALIDAVTEGEEALPVVQLLLRHDASVDFRDSKALILAASKGSASTLQVLLSSWPTPRQRALAEAFRAAMDLPAPKAAPSGPSRQTIIELLTKTSPNWASLGSVLSKVCSDEDDRLVEHLVSLGADPNANDGRCVLVATKNYDFECLRHLMKNKPNPAVCSQGFAIATTHQDRSRKFRIFVQILELFLQGGATGQAVDDALVEAIDAGDAGRHVLEALLTATPGPNVNSNGGRCLQLAVRRNDHNLTAKLLNKGPNTATLSMAFSSVFEAVASEAELMAMAQLFFDHAPEDKRIFYSANELSNSPLYQCLHLHPDKPQLLQLLVDNECPMDTVFRRGFVPDMGQEDVSPLLWLMCQADKTSDRIFQIVLAHSADVNFRTKASGMTSLGAASACASPDVIKSLLEADGDVHSEDHAGRTPLYFAATAGKVDNMNLLIAAGASCNDEALHTAVQKLNLRAVGLLLENHADVDRPGFIASDGRSPLGELCRHGDCESYPSQVKSTLKALLKASPKLRMVVDGKSILVLALDNPSPLKMTRILLNASTQICNNINDEANIYRTTCGRCYSPTMYVRHFKSPQSPIPRRRSGYDNNSQPPAELELLLRTFGCKDRFWDDTAGPNQPTGWCEPPAHITAAIDARRLQLEREVEAVRLRQEEEARLLAEQQRLAAIQAQQEVEAVRLRQEEEARLLAEQQRLAAIQAQQEAEEARERRLREERRAAQRAEAAEETRREQARVRAAQSVRDAEIEDDRRRYKALAKDAEESERRRARIRQEGKRKEADIAKEVLREKKKLFDSVKDAAFAQMMIEGASGGQRSGGGRVIGELEY